MKQPLDGNAIVYCERAFGTPNGKTAHGLVRRTARYRILCVMDSRHAGADAGTVLDGRRRDIPIVDNLGEALAVATAAGEKPTHMVVGLAPDGGRAEPGMADVLLAAMARGLNVDCGLHSFLSEDPRFVWAAEECHVKVRDIRKPPPRDSLHFFSGKIDEVGSFRVALLGTDSAVGKRTTAWMLADGLGAAGASCEFIGTGQTAWMQGARYGIILDSLVNDFVTGEIEHVVWRAWNETKPEIMVLEGQGSLLNPAYPGGHELIAAGRPHVIVMQHAPARSNYDGFPRYPLHPLGRQIQAATLLADRPVIAVTLNREGLSDSRVEEEIERVETEHQVVCVEPLSQGVSRVVDAVLQAREKTL
jgi:uncharacterized NAD-dependent epimerase/dehydratase family protein